MASKQVFISHISAESELARRLKQRLDGDFLGMFEVFVSSDRETIRAGQKWLDEVDRALRAADAQLILCSRESVGRPWVQFEAGAAWLRRIPVIPVCHSGMTLAELPVPLNMLQGIECASAEGLQKLYDALAAVLGVKTPAVDFQALATQLRPLQGAPGAAAAIERIDEPRILCAASPQYARLGFDGDVAVLEQVFGAQRVLVERALSRRRLSDLLSTQRFDIVHLVAGVEPTSGDVIFSDLDLQRGVPASARVDRLSPAGLANLLAEAKTRLVVLATCRALKLAVVLARSLNMIGTEEDLSAEQAAEWSECFYHLLRQGQALHKAYDLAKSQVDAPLLLVPHRDVVFALPQG